MRVVSRQATLSTSSVSLSLLLALVLPGRSHADAASDIDRLSEGPATAATREYSVGRPAEYFLEALVNDADTGLIVTCLRQGGAWWTKRTHLASLGLRVDDLLADPDGWVSLDGISGLSYRYDAAYQRLYVTVLASRRSLFVLRNESAARPGDPATGAILNYDAVLERQHGVSVLRTFTEQRLYGGAGVVSNTGLHRTGGLANNYVRLDTSWTHADVATMRTLTVGDFITRSLNWSRSVRIGGLQFRRNFELRPDLVSYPVAAFTGEVAVPSTVDVYVNQVRRLTSEVPAGPFRIETPPSLNGAGQATLVVRDALGRDTLRTFDLYVVPQLLAEGLSDYSFEAGVPRRSYGLESNDYAGGVVASATLRHGIRNWLTLESHAEAAGELYQLGGGALFGIGRYGRVDVSLAVSRAERTGEQFSLGYQYVSQRFSVSAGIRQASSDYRNLPSLLGDRPPRREARFFMGSQITPRIHVSGSYLVSESRSRLVPATGTPVPADDGGPITRLVSLGYRHALTARIALSASAFRDVARSKSGGIYAAFSVAFGKATQLHTDYSSADDRGGIALSQRSPYVRGLDWNLRAGGGKRDYARAGARYTGDKGAVMLDVAREVGQARWQIGGRGALALAGSSVIVGRYLEDEFAVVSTNGVADVPVLHENRPAGRTDRNGYLLLSNLNAYQANRVAIDPLAVPFRLRLGKTERVAVPRLEAGTRVDFALAESRAVTLTLIDAAGRPVAVGSRATLADTGRTYVVGYDGVLFLANTSEAGQLLVDTGTGHCKAHFDIADHPVHAVDAMRVSCR